MIDISTIAYIGDVAEQLAVLAEKSHDDLVAYLLRLAARAAVERVAVENARRATVIRRSPPDGSENPS